ncbi:MAG: ParB/RepB/Spo0J family partition protein [Alphaproteobacteria bacterium]|jgi:ParB-like chromosome segregation protein Spo0J|nr:ParB/RepB/Spo0J family partition protein [Alphaproteobacteria bacterium]
MEVKFPVLSVKLVNITKIVANDYNPNKVATPEMKLLERSIIEDGYTQPIVCYHDKEKDTYIIVDGFHRYTIGKKLKLKQLPIVVIEKEIEDRIASTIRHNRARGVHTVDGMSEIMKILIKSGRSDSWIEKNIGMDKNEILRLKQITGLAEVFKNEEFSKAWEEVEKVFE